jgi:uncharacterized protein YegJ (DUF2314 family)
MSQVAEQITLIDADDAFERKRLWQNLHPNTEIKYGSIVLIAITAQGITEHMWVEVFAQNDRWYKGLLANNPLKITSLKFQDIITFNYSDIQNYIPPMDNIDLE